VVEAGGGTDFPVGSRVMFTGPVWRLGRCRPQGETSLMADEQNSGPLLEIVMPGVQEVSS
jgi:hypothetical protein